MENEIDDFEEEEDSFEEEEKITKPKKVKKKVIEEESEKEPSERYVAFYQEPRMGIVDTVTQEVVIEGLNDLNLTKLEALKLNKLDKIGLVTGTE